MQKTHWTISESAHSDTALALLTINCTEIHPCIQNIYFQKLSTWTLCVHNTTYVGFFFCTSTKGVTGVVMLAQQCGFSIREIRCFVKGFPNNQSPAELWRQAASVKINTLENQREDIDRTIELLGQVGTCQCKSFEQCGQEILEWVQR